MREAGLIGYWYKRNTADIHQCLHTKPRGVQKLDNGDPLSLKAFAGGFIFLTIGCAASLFVLIREICTNRCFS